MALQTLNSITLFSWRDSNVRHNDSAGQTLRNLSALHFSVSETYHSFGGHEHISGATPQSRISKSHATIVQDIRDDQFSYLWDFADTSNTD